MTRQVPDFDARYRADPDPWGVASDWYERRKRAVLLASLPRERYRRAWDAACGNGVLAHDLDDRCAEILASDASPRAVELAGVRCASAPHVQVAQIALPDDPLPSDNEPFDLVVLSEVLYYLEESDRSATLRVVDQAAAGDAQVVVVHWRHWPDDTATSGAVANEEALATLGRLGWSGIVHHDDADFVLDVMAR